MRGSFLIGARASSWSVYSAPQHSLAVSDDIAGQQPGIGAAARRLETKAIESGGYIAPGSIITDLGTSRSDLGFSLRLRFSDGSTSFVKPAPESCESSPEELAETYDVGEMEVSDWEILTPDQRILRVGPGPRWSYPDSKKGRSG